MFVAITLSAAAPASARSIGSSLNNPANASGVTCNFAWQAGFGPIQTALTPAPGEPWGGSTAPPTGFVREVRDRSSIRDRCRGRARAPESAAPSNGRIKQVRVKVPENPARLRVTVLRQITTYVPQRRVQGHVLLPGHRPIWSVPAEAEPDFGLQRQPQGRVRIPPRTRTSPGSTTSGSPACGTGNVAFRSSPRGSRRTERAARPAATRRGILAAVPRPTKRRGSARSRQVKKNKKTTLTATTGQCGSSNADTALFQVRDGAASTTSAARGN